ncbi:hypothetical protein ATANTOWER_023740, partial [Ataeniobius toweri]|nr:hypothetical protein [Ataeniobius toweri]
PGACSHQHPYKNMAARPPSSKTTQRQEGTLNPLGRHQPTVVARSKKKLQSAIPPSEGTREPKRVGSPPKPSQVPAAHSQPNTSTRTIGHVPATQNAATWPSPPHKQTIPHQGGWPPQQIFPCNTTRAPRSSPDHQFLPNQYIYICPLHNFFIVFCSSKFQTVGHRHHEYICLCQTPLTPASS